jgi:hypothetical protein
MNALRMVVCAATLFSGTVAVCHAQDTPADPAAYKQKLHACVTQMKTDHPDMNHDARRKACHKQLGPAPKSPAAAATAPKP